MTGVKWFTGDSWKGGSAYTTRSRSDATFTPLQSDHPGPQSIAVFEAIPVFCAPGSYATRAEAVADSYLQDIDYYKRTNNHFENYFQPAWSLRVVR